MAVLHSKPARPWAPRRPPHGPRCRPFRRSRRSPSKCSKPLSKNGLRRWSIRCRSRRAPSRSPNPAVWTQDSSARLATVHKLSTPKKTRCEVASGTRRVPSRLQSAARADGHRGQDRRAALRDPERRPTVPATESGPARRERRGLAGVIHEAAPPNARIAPCGKKGEGTERTRVVQPARAAVTEPAQRAVAEWRPSDAATGRFGRAGGAAS